MPLEKATKLAISSAISSLDHAMNADNREKMQDRIECALREMHLAVNLEGLDPTTEDYDLIVLFKLLMDKIEIGSARSVMISLGPWR